MSHETNGDPGRHHDEQRVEALLGALALEDARVTAPPHLESHVMQAWVAHQSRPLRRRGGRWIALTWRFAAVVLVLSAIYYSLPGRRAPATVAPADDTLASPLVDETGVPLVADPLADPTALTVMRVRMSRSALANLGLPILDPDAAGVVDVEVLVGEDGVARSIRRAAFAETHVIEE